MTGIGPETGVRPTRIPGCVELQSKNAGDRRGQFVKPYSASLFARLGLETDFVESFYTVSQPGVLRGMHFQLPPADHAKLVYCISGAVMDVGLDLRRGSPAFQHYEVFNLDAEACNAVYLPRGLAHGFYVVRGPAIVMYHVTSEHAPALDAGITWNSFGLAWPDSTPVLSQRDSSLPCLADFDTPFRLDGQAAG